MQQNKIFGLLLFSLLISSVFVVVQPAYAIQATGGTITYSGGYTIHTFTSSGTFTVTSGSGDVEYLVVAGGGGATTTYGSGGGGGAGGFRAGTLGVTPQAYPITVGAGGASGAGAGGNGGDSIFSTITSTGGGGGGGASGGSGAAGGSGGGGGDAAGPAGSGTGGQGNDGGVGAAGGGGGGGASAVGSTGATGTGGAGTASSISGTSVTYAGGGGGSIAAGSSGGAGGGGNGGGVGIASTSGTANRGGGAGAAGSIAGGNTGGSGIVIIRYLTANPPDAVDDLVSTSTGSTTVDLDWTEPSLGGGGQYLLGYQINKTTPWGLPTVLVNDTGTSTSAYTASGLTIGTDYSFRVSAWTNNTSGHPFNNATGNILNVTTAMPQIVCCAPVLTADSGSSTQIDLQWSASTLQNLRGYKIERQTPSGSSWATLVSNTTNTNIYYNNTGLTSNIIYNYRVYGLNSTGQSSVSNSYEMTTFHLPNAVTTLTGTATDLSTIDLSWTAPTSYAPVIQGYMINGTTPTGEPVDILNSNTGSTATTATALNLLIGEEYSFRVSPITVHGMNASGNIWNGSTIQTFVIGNLSNPDITNDDDFLIFFNRTDINSTAIQLDVTYPNSYNLSCDFDYKYARINHTYSGLTTVPDGTDDQVATFTLINATGDLIQVRCWDTLTGDESKYVITITDFPFLEQVRSLRNGDYGTFFQIGAFDGVMLIIIFLGMIGLNRTTPIVGIIFVVITTLVMSYFELITYPVIMYPALIMMIVWAFVTTRKDD